MARKSLALFVLAAGLSLPSPAWGMRISLSGYGGINSTPYNSEHPFFGDETDHETHYGFGGEFGIALAENISISAGLLYYETAEYECTFIVIPYTDPIQACPLFALLRIGLPLENSPLVIGFSGGVNYSFWHSSYDESREYHGRLGYQVGVFFEFPFGGGMALLAEIGYLAMEGYTSDAGNDYGVYSRGLYAHAGIRLSFSMED